MPEDTAHCKRFKIEGVFSWQAVVLIVVGSAVAIAGALLKSEALIAVGSSIIGVVAGASHPKADDRRYRSGGSFGGSAKIPWRERMHTPD